MICPKGHYVTENALACSQCATQRAEAAFRSLQAEFLRKAARGEFSYCLRVAKGRDRHVLMFSSYTRTFCGKELNAKPQIRYESYDDATVVNICASCRSAIASLMREVAP
jgi:hypothetical protein